MRGTIKRVAVATATIAGLLAIAPLGAHGLPPTTVNCATAPCPTDQWSRTVSGNVQESTPAVSDLNGDGVLDVVVGTNNGTLYALAGASGADLAGWPVPLGRGINSSPSIADVDGNGSPEIFVGSGTPDVADGAFWSFRTDGSQRFRYVAKDRDFNNPSIHSTAAIGDTNSDGRADLSFGALALSIWNLDRDGGVNWNADADDTVYSSPALVDVNNDGYTDVVIGGDATPGGTVDHAGGVLRALDGRTGGELWHFFTDNAIVRSSPSVGDIDGDGAPEIVVGVGDYTGSIGPDSRKVYAFNLNGTLKAGWPQSTDGITMGSPALADVDGDGKLDVVIGTRNDAASSGSVYVFNGNGTVKANYPRSSTGGVVIGSVVTADINSDGNQDLLVPTGGGMRVFDGPSGAKLFGLSEGSVSYQNSATVADIDGNGRLDIITAGIDPVSSNGIVRRYEMPAASPGTLGALSWPTFRKDMRRTGSWTNPPLTRSLCPPPGGGGYWMVARDGGVFSFCDAKFHGSTGALTLAKPVVGMASTPSGQGYWLVASDGGIFAFGDAKFFGSTGAITLNKPVVGMARTPSGNGYWLVASDGGIFAYGDAKFFGSTGAITLNQPVVAMATTPTGNGYWLIARDGGVFAYGDAKFFGSTGSIKLNQPIVGAVATPSGNGYWMVATDGGIFAFGDAPFRGSTGAIKLNQPVVGMTRRADGQGYWLVASDGGIFAFNAPFFGSTGNIKLNQPVVAIAAPGI